MPNAKIQAEVFNQLLVPKGTKNPDTSDDNRLIFQHDRDRILWSPSFKRLSNKTQVFSQVYSDHHRRRLTHSLEVMQLATSLARTLGLNFILCEAIALGHDLGHTPFGHAGEEALNTIFEKIEILDRNNRDLKKKVKGINGFSHYEHAIDIVSYIDSRDPSDPLKEKIGLQLSEETLEGIFKHTYDRTKDESKYKSLKNILSRSKYRFPGNFGTPEAQLVRICDKISYLISDIEDGLLINAIHIDDLLGYELFKNVKEITRPMANYSDARVFQHARNKILTSIVDSVIAHSRKLLEREGPEFIDFEPDLKEEDRKIWNNLKKEKLFKHFLVEKANTRAKHIVNCLFCTFLRNPELIPWRFRRKYISTTSAYNNRVAQIYDTNQLNEKIQINLTNWYDEIGKNLKGLSSNFIKEKVDDKKTDVTMTDLIYIMENTFRNLSNNCREKVIDSKITNATLAELICVKDYIAGMTDNFAETNFINNVDCHISRTIWKNHKMDNLRKDF